MVTELSSLDNVDFVPLIIHFYPCLVGGRKPEFEFIEAVGNEGGGWGEDGGFTGKVELSVVCATMKVSVVFVKNVTNGKKEEERPEDRALRYTSGYRKQTTAVRPEIYF